MTYKGETRPDLILLILSNNKIFYEIEPELLKREMNAEDMW